VARGGCRLLVALAGAIVAFGVGTAASAATLYVDKGNPACSNTGPGSSTVPFCTIGTAAGKTLAPGDTVLVNAGDYREKVTIKKVGNANAPIVFQANPGVTVGAGQTIGFDFSGAQWVTLRGFTVSGTTTDGVRTQLSSNLLVDGNRILNAGGRGIYTKDCTGCTFKDNVVDHSLNYGIYVVNGLQVKITGGEVSYAGLPTSSSTVRKGVYFYNTTSSSISGVKVHHNTEAGIYVASSSTGIEVARNICFSNARGYTRAAPGIEIRTTTGNLVWGNVSFANEDTGIQLYTGANANHVVANVLYLNGDHGVDVKGSTDVRVIGNSVYGNDTSGINVEGTSPRATVKNNISVDNGIDSTRTRGNIRVDSSSIPGTQVDFNLVNLTQPSGQTMYTWGSTKYPTLQALRNAVPGVEVNAIQAVPGWVNAPFPIPADLPPAQDPDDPPPADLRLTAGSAAINSADPAANKCLNGSDARDASGFARSPVDRGALEFFNPYPDPATGSFSCGGV
jgi:parallel beta-helix repeat protein